MSQSDSVLQLQYQETLLSEENLVYKREDAKPHDGSDVDTERRRHDTPSGSQQRLGGEHHQDPGQLLDVQRRVPGQDDSREHGEAHQVEEWIQHVG